MSAKKIPTAIKRKVYYRDEGKCVNCGSVENLEFDHIIPYSKGGANTENNVQLLCSSCNHKKYNRFGVVHSVELALDPEKWASVSELAEKVRLSEKTVYLRLNKLQNKNLIESKTIKRDKKGRPITVFRILISSIRVDSLIKHEYPSFEDVGLKLENNLRFLLRVLFSSPGLTAKEISIILDKSQKTIYFYIKKLQSKDLLTSEIVKKTSKTGRHSRIYRLKQ